MFTLFIADTRGKVHFLIDHDQLTHAARAFDQISHMLETQSQINVLACICHESRILDYTVIWHREEGIPNTPRFSVTSQGGMNATLRRLFADVWTIPQFRQLSSSAVSSTSTFRSVATAQSLDRVLVESPSRSEKEKRLNRLDRNLWDLLAKESSVGGRSKSRIGKI